MNKSFLLGAAAYVLPSFPLGYVWHLVAFADRYHELGLYRAEVIIPLGLSAMLIQAVIFAAVYPRVVSTERREWLKSAVKYGSVAAVFAWSFTTLPVAAKYQMSSVPQFLLLETGFTLLHFAVVSPLIALAYRKSA
jgi:hypothetical protein